MAWPKLNAFSVTLAIHLKGGETVVSIKTLFFVFFALIFGGNISCYGANSMNFDGQANKLESAIINDDAREVELIIQSGVDPNVRGFRSVTPLEFAVGNRKANSVNILLRMGADPNLKDDEGDTPVTMAVRAYKSAPDILSKLLKFGGDPNTLDPSRNPIMVRFINDRNITAIRFLRANGADIDARDRSGNPLIIYAGIIEFWDVVECLLELGARFDYTGEPWTIEDAFSKKEITPPDSPLWPHKVRSWKFLTERGVKLPPM